jgi:hypothetical protein
MTKPTAELACRDMVTGLRITVDGSVQKVEMPKNAILAGLYAAIGCDAVDVVRLADQLDMWIDDEGLYNRRQPVLYRSNHRAARARRYGNPCPRLGVCGPGGPFSPGSSPGRTPASS